MTKLATDFSGHGGGDVRMVLEFLEMIATGKEPQGITSLEQSINSHLVAFAAEESRLNHGTPVEIGTWKSRIFSNNDRYCGIKTPHIRRC